MPKKVPVSLNPDFTDRVKTNARGFYNDNKSLITRIVSTLLALVFIFYIIYQVYSSSVEKVSTFTAVEQTVNESIFTKGYFVRDEKYIQNSASGTVVPVAEDGKKVSNGNTVAIAFGSDSDAANYTRINTLKAEIERYEKLDAVSPSSSIDIKTVDMQINDSVSNVVDGIVSGELDALQDGYAQFRDSVIKKHLVLGEKVDFNNIISGLRAELAELEAKPISYKEILADGSGYYISAVDGYESLCNSTDVKTITPENAEKLFEASPKSVPENVMGKLVTGFDWYIVCVLDVKQISNLSVGSKLTIDFPYAATENLKAEVAAVNVSGAKKAAVVLKCKTMNEELANMRFEDVELVFKTIKGYKIPGNAVREVNGVKGVYILRASLVNFREINIVLTTEDYVITADPVPPDTSGMTPEQKEEALAALPENEVEQYDEIIVKGKDLYDGKTIS